MRKSIIVLCFVLLTLGLAAQDNDKTLNERGEIIKRGRNIGALPVVGYNSDLGFQYGACVDIFNYGDGSKYPTYDFKTNLEMSFYTEGSSILRTYSYWNNIIPKGRLFVDIGYFTNIKFDFYGYNGYASPYLKDMASGFYDMNRAQFRTIVSMRQQIGNVKNLYYGLGLGYYNYDCKRLNVKENEDLVTLYELYCESGLIRADEKGGGNVSQLKAGLIYDSKNYENDPTRGFYVEATFTAAPDLIDKNGYDHLMFTGVFHHYIPIFGEKLTFCYRLGAQNVIAGDIPFYALTNTNLLFFNKTTTEAFGGSTTGRGINTNRVVGQGIAWFNAELRWRMVNFKFINQNWIVALNPMFDAGTVTQAFRLEEQKTASGLYNNLIYSGKDEGIHTSAGCGLKFIMNRNFVVSVEIAKAFDKLDGEGMKAYVGFNYIF